MIKGKFRIIQKKESGDVIKGEWSDNIVLFNATNGVTKIRDKIFADTSDSLEIDALAIGTGDTEATEDDTSLESETLGSVQIANKTKVGNTGILYEFFIADNELADDTYNEVGLKASSDLFTRALFQNSYVKASGTDTIIEYSLTFSN